jgi:DNA polymerase
MLVGEAPGEQEDLAGQPFVGRAGEVLSAHLAKYFVSENLTVAEGDMWITNVVKCRPIDEKKDNRIPSAEEISACHGWLEREIKTVRPWIIVALGKTATSRILPGDWTKEFGKNVGRVVWHKDYHCGVLITYHPSFVARGNEKGANAYAEHFKWLKSVTESPAWWWRNLMAWLRENGEIVIEGE